MEFPVKYVSSPNKSSRTKGINGVVGGVVHWTASYAGPLAIANYFKNPYVDVSAHAVIGRDGLIVRCVHPKFKAWHAGKSKYDFNRDGKFAQWEYNLNDVTVGWELCHMPGQNWPDMQIRALAKEIRYANRVCPNFKYAYMVDHEAISLSGKWDVDSSFPAAKMFWYVLHGPNSEAPKNVYEQLPKWAQRQTNIIKKES